MTVSKNVKHRVIWPRSSIPSYMSKRNKNICPHKNLYTNVERNISQSPKKYKQSKCLITDEWINKQMCYIHTMEYYSSVKRNEVQKYAITWWTLKAYNKWKTVAKNHISGFIFMKPPE